MRLVDWESLRALSYIEWMVKSTADPEGSRGSLYMCFKGQLLAVDGERTDASRPERKCCPLGSLLLSCCAIFCLSTPMTTSAFTRKRLLNSPATISRAPQWQEMDGLTSTNTRGKHLETQRIKIRTKAMGGCIVKLGLGRVPGLRASAQNSPDHEALTVRKRGLQVLVTDVHMRYKVH